MCTSRVWIHIPIHSEGLRSFEDRQNTFQLQTTSFTSESFTSAIRNSEITNNVLSIYPLIDCSPQDLNVRVWHLTCTWSKKKKPMHEPKVWSDEKFWVCLLKNCQQSFTCWEYGGIIAVSSWNFNHHPSTVNQELLGHYWNRHLRQTLLFINILHNSHQKLIFSCLPCRTVLIQRTINCRAMVAQNKLPSFLIQESINMFYQKARIAFVWIRNSAEQYKRYSFLFSKKWWGCREPSIPLWFTTSWVSCQALFYSLI